MAKFELFIPILTKVEGGYQNLIGDSGNYNSLGQRVGTNFGISARFYEDIIGRPPSIADMKAISKSLALSLYREYFWNDIQGDTIQNQSIANLICDHDVNAGERSIALIVQKILKNHFHINIAIDGDIGPQTASAINSVNQNELFNLIKEGRREYYNAIGGQFLQSWLNRLKAFTYLVTEKKKGF